MNRIFRFGYHAGFAVILMIVVSPLLWMAVSSIRPSADLLSPGLGSGKITFSNYRYLFTETRFLRYLFNSFFIGTTVACVATALALVTAYCYNRVLFKGRQVLGWLTMLVYMVAPIMLVIPLYIIFNVLSIGNTYAAIIIAHVIFVFPFAFWMLNRYLAEFPLEMEKSAIADGAGFYDVFFKIVIPNMAPAIQSVVIFGFILSWNDYVFARILITGDEKKTVSLGVEELFNATVTNWGPVMACGVIISVPIILVYFMISRYLDKKLFLKYL